MGRADSASESVTDLDDIDREIIRALQSDGRMPYSQLGPRVGLSDAAARQRVNRLTTHGFIRIIAVTDPSTMGIGDEQGLLGVTVGGDVRKVASEISALNDACYVVMTAGRFDLIAEIICRDRDTFIDVSTDVRSLPGVEAVEVLPYLGVVKESYDWGVE